jgi:hypothetical protein
MASSQGVAPEGFELKMRLDPKPGEDGVIRQGSPVTVEVDLCGSVVEPGKTAHFLFDFNDDDIAEIAGTGDACVQKHTYKAPADATKEVVLESNVCVTNGDPNVHNGSVYFSCRRVRVALAPATASCTSGLPEGCYQPVGFFGFLGWPGGTGPHFPIFAFGDAQCTQEDDEAPAPVVLACSEEAARALCGTEFVQGFGQFENGQIGFLCDPFPTLTTNGARGGVFKH